MILNKQEKLIKYSNRGMSFEKIITDILFYYNKNNIMYVLKRPTPIKILSVKNGIITKAVYENQSTLDYVGIYKDKYIEFEAKSTISRTSFNFNNILNHQESHIKKLHNLNAICFIIIEFSSFSRYFILPINLYLEYLNQNKRSIKISELEKRGIEISISYKPFLRLKEAIDKLL